MSRLTYTDGDVRAEAARQYAELHRDPDLLDDALESGKQMRDTPIPSAVATRNAEDGITWGHLPYDDLHDASRQVRELIEDAPDLSRWAVDLAASYLKPVTNVAWGHGNCWDLAVQIAHRPGIKADLHDELVAAIRSAVRGVLDQRSIDCPEIPQHDTSEEAAR